MMRSIVADDKDVIANFRDPGHIHELTSALGGELTVARKDDLTLTYRCDHEWTLNAAISCARCRLGEEQPSGHPGTPPL